MGTGQATPHRQITPEERYTLKVEVGRSTFEDAIVTCTKQEIPLKGVQLQYMYL